MKITAILLDYPPHRYIGAELATHRLLKALQVAGHDVIVRTTTTDDTDVFDGIALVPDRTTEPGTPDLVITNAGLAVHCRHQYPGIPLAAYAHNNRTHTLADIEAAHPEVVIANTHHMADVIWSVMGKRAIVLHPPIAPPTPTVTGQSLTIVNFSNGKGGDIAWDVARRRPHLNLLAVMGGYGNFHIPELPNVTVVEHTRHLDPIWAQTRVLLLPSTYESYSMTAVEAASHGIPCIATDLPGVREALGDGALYVDSADPNDWANAVDHTLAEWPQYARQARLHASNTLAAQDAELATCAHALTHARAQHPKPPTTTGPVMIHPLLTPAR